MFHAGEPKFPSTTAWTHTIKALGGLKYTASTKLSDQQLTLAVQYVDVLQPTLFQLRH